VIHAQEQIDGLIDRFIGRLDVELEPNVFAVGELIDLGRVPLEIDVRHIRRVGAADRCTAAVQERCRMNRRDQVARTRAVDVDFKQCPDDVGDLDGLGFPWFLRLRGVECLFDRALLDLEIDGFDRIFAGLEPHLGQPAVNGLGDHVLGRALLVSDLVLDNDGLANVIEHLREPAISLFVDRFLARDRLLERRLLTQLLGALD
jgi:hypothetical protein